MSNPRFIKLSNGVCFDLNAVRLIARKEINEYVVVLEGTGVQPRADANDVEFMESLFTIEQAPPPVSAVAVPELKTKLAIAD